MNSYHTLRDQTEALESSARHFENSADLHELIEQRESWSHQITKDCNSTPGSAYLYDVKLRIGWSNLFAISLTLGPERGCTMHNVEVQCKIGNPNPENFNTLSNSDPGTAKLMLIFYFSPNSNIVSSMSCDDNLGGKLELNIEESLYSQGCVRV